MSEALRQAAQQALEALDSAIGAVDGQYYDAVVPSANIAADALRAALAAEPVQQPAPIYLASDGAFYQRPTLTDEQMQAFARAIEAAFKIKEQP